MALAATSTAAALGLALPSSTWPAPRHVAPDAITNAEEPADPATYLDSLQSELQKTWPKNRTLRVVCHGHSVPAGYFKTPVVDTFNAYPHLLHVALKQRFPHAVLNVIVTSIGGEDSDSGSKRFDRDVLALRPDLITIDYGLNDRRIGLQRSRRSITSMLRAARRHKIPVLLLTPTADLRAKWDNANDPLHQQAVLLRQLAAESGVGLVDSSAAFRRAIRSGTKPGDLMSQSNHPNRAGHDLVVGELMKWFPRKRQR